MNTDRTESSIDIEHIAEASIINYFATIDREEFGETAALFAEDGIMLAPFESPIVGREAIALYLAKEAKGMNLLPKEGVYQPTEDNSFQIMVRGKVQTSLFSVNVAWYFNLNDQQQITTVKIKLLASPKELLNLRESNISS